jgi:hypothetical protein
MILSLAEGSERTGPGPIGMWGEEEPHGFPVDGAPLQPKGVAWREPQFFTKRNGESGLPLRSELDLEHEVKIYGAALLFNK